MFKRRKNKTFNYKPRFSQGNEKDSKEDAFREDDFISKWKQTREANKSKVRGVVSIRTLVLLLVLLLICMYLLETKFM
ncbi:hypothetical protein [Snuella sedimenti]|uniref:Uncharacterized protein n=1 Tax=Snuella sedimenti TaxID=2798802 RepID=A0A8J7LXL7_9FLAO|nr:hypothetical protein [Snuella sedimenti]MBJ6366956.1 hypothetical protein [Snuella sedimenti]